MQLVERAMDLAEITTDIGGVKWIRRGLVRGSLVVKGGKTEGIGSVEIRRKRWTDRGDRTERLRGRQIDMRWSILRTGLRG